MGTRLGVAVASIGLLVTGLGCSDAEPECRPADLHQVPFGAQDDTFWVGPYLGHTTTSTVLVSWETGQAGSSRVEYGPDEAYGSSAEGPPGTVHHVRVEGLEPARVYHYRACTDGTCSGDLTFATAPGPGQPLRFAVYGDTRSDPPKHQAVAERIVADAPALVINVGDIVEDGRNREEFKQMHFDPTRRLGHFAPVYVAIGNHERKDIDAVHFNDYLAFPSESLASFPELLENQAGTSFSFTYGDAFFLIWDSTLDHLDLFFPVAGYEPPLWHWLQEQVASEAAQQARWRFAFAHYPADSVCYDPGNLGWPSGAIREFVLPLFWAHGFQAFFAGHQHDYERFDFDGHLVMTTGGGGAGLEDPDNCIREVPEIRDFRSVHHHVTVDLGCDSALVRAVDVEGEVFEELTLSVDGTYQVGSR